MCAPWLEGTCGGYKFQAMVFDEPSIYGINDGRISKLFITPDPKNWSKCTTEYDRGWSISSGKGHAALVQRSVISILETL